MAIGQTRGMLTRMEAKMDATQAEMNIERKADQARMETNKEMLARMHENAQGIQEDIKSGQEEMKSTVNAF
jgi:hypothetical protein